MNDRKLTYCRICETSYLRLSRHIRSHDISYLEYLLKYEHNDIWPLCLCGCNEKVEFRITGVAGFRTYIVGHHMNGRHLSEEAREEIGRKNSKNMLEFFKKNPDEKSKRVKAMLSGHTVEGDRSRIKKLIDNNRSLEKRNVISKRTKERWLSGEMKEAKEKANVTLKEGFRSGRLFRTEKQKNDISISITRKYLEGGFKWSRGKYFSSKVKKAFYYRSSWELRHMEFLDLNDNVSSWNYEPHIIHYEWKGRIHRYLPDFLVNFVDGSIELQEIGVKKLKESSRNIAKFEAAKIWCAQNNATFRLVSTIVST